MTETATTVDGVLLRSASYREADRVLTFFTRERGMLATIARGAKRSKRRFGGSLEPFAVVRLQLGRGRGSLTPLTEATVVRPFPAILRSLDAMQEGGAALDLVRRVAREEHEEPRLFDAVVAFFEALSVEGADPEALRLAFSMRALSLLGMAPGLQRCAVSGVRCPPGQPAYFDAERGGIVRQSLGGRGVLLSAAARGWLIAACGEAWSNIAVAPTGDVAALPDRPPSLTSASSRGAAEASDPPAAFHSTRLSTRDQARAAVEGFIQSHVR